MHSKLCLTICQAKSGQPLGRDDRFQSRMRHQSLSRGDWLFVCAAVALHLSEAEAGWLLPLPLHIHCSYLTSCYTLNAQCGNAYLHFAGPSLCTRHIVWPCCCWTGRRAGVSRAGLVVRLFLPSLLLSIYSKMGWMEDCWLFVLSACRSSLPAATVVDWQVVKMSLCAYQKVGTKAFLLTCSKLQQFSGSGAEQHAHYSNLPSRPATLHLNTVSRQISS